MMSAIIKDIKIPKYIGEHTEFDRYGGFLTVYENGKVELHIFDTDYTIESIPTPHGRLIDADVNVGSYVETWTCNCSEFGTQRVMAVDDLKYLPTIIEAEVSE